MLAKLTKTTKFVLECKYKYSRIPTRIEKIKWVKDSVQQLGSTYIKIGQFIANRPDSGADPIVIEALEALHDDADPMPWETVHTIMSNHYPDMDLIFDEIEHVPVASASIGQVHRAKLANTDDYVAIKIRRPDIIKEVKLDISLLITVVQILSIFSIEKEQFQDVQKMLKDVERSIINESDMRKELKNMAAFIPSPKIKIPTIYKDLSSEDILVMEFVPCIKFRDAFTRAGDKKELANRIMSVFVEQFLFNGMIHGDPHPGNMALLPDRDTFVMYDFGHIVKLDDTTMNYMKLLVFELISENVKNVISILEEIPHLIELRTKDDVESYIKNYIKYIKSIDVKVLQGMAGRDSKIPFKFSGTIFEIIRIFGIVEGICIELNPDFSYEDIFSKYATQILASPDFILLKAYIDSKTLIDRYM